MGSVASVLWIAVVDRVARFDVFPSVMSQALVVVVDLMVLMVVSNSFEIIP